MKIDFFKKINFKNIFFISLFFVIIIFLFFDYFDFIANGRGRIIELLPRPTLAGVKLENGKKFDSPAFWVILKKGMLLKRKNIQLFIKSMGLNIMLFFITF